MPDDLLIRNARAILPDSVLHDADILVRGGMIAAVVEGRLDAHASAEIDAEGRWLLPGLVDVHCDAIEKEAQPRPGVRMPFDMALRELDRKLALCGITTMYHSISFGAGEGVRSNQGAADLVRAITAFARKPSLVRHQAHLRLEISNDTAFPIVEQLIDEQAIGLLSFMDHTPGQGQYRDARRYREYIRKTYWVGEAEIDRIVREKHAGRERVRDEDLHALARQAENAWIPVAGHDPDTLAAVDVAIERGADLLEFPIRLDIGLYAVQRGMWVCVGAPNVLHGRSHDGNLSAREAIGAGAANVLCSDYYPSGLLTAIFQIAADGIVALPTAVAMASVNAAASVRLDHVAGAIQPGWRADLLVVSTDLGSPVVEITIVGGQIVLSATTRSTAAAASDRRPSYALSGRGA